MRGVSVVGVLLKKRKCNGAELEEKFRCLSHILAIDLSLRKVFIKSSICPLLESCFALREYFFSKTFDSDLQLKNN